jgi:hypothetical protein
MATIISSWATSPITPNGVLSGPEWASAGKMPIPAGYLLAKNDSTFLYIALDMVGDHGNDPGVGDYFWFSVDNNHNHAITPHVDVNYGIYPSLPIRIGRQYYLGPGVWTGIQNTPSPALAHNGFGASPNSPVPHRIWEMRLPLAEIGIPHLGASPNPLVRFGVRVSSCNPAFTFDYPNGFYTNFANLHEILLATGAAFTAAGPAIGGVGLIPETQIHDGYATTPSGYYVPADEAAFGGTLNIIGNRTTLQSLWAAGARKYKVLHRAGVAGPFAPLLQSWLNYHWNGTTYVLQNFAWDASSYYPMLNPAEDYSIDDLLVQWNTVGSIGLHELQTQFFRPDNSLVAAPPQTLRLMIDNNLPLVDVVEIRHNGAAVSACAIVNMTDASDGVQAKITVNDFEGHLKDLELRAYWGNGASALIYQDSYAAHRNPVHMWNGPSGLVVPAAEWVPPTTCAYEFRLAAWPRVTNGYNYIGYAEDEYHVTLIKPGSVMPTMIRLLETRLPLGQKTNGLPPDPGTEPAKLGAETLG